MVSVDILKHTLVPRHEVLSPAEKKELLEKLNIIKEELPKIYSSDPVFKHIKAKVGDVIRITRKSQTAGTAMYYRAVIEG